MPELPRNLPHLYLRARGKAEPYATKLKQKPSQGKAYTPLAYSNRSQIISQTRPADSDARLQHETTKRPSPGKVTV